jgi:hypothetical protein
MPWNDLASNEMVSFTDAQTSGFTLKSGQSHVTSNQCMTRFDFITKYNVTISGYSDNQLVPKSALDGTPVNCVVSEWSAWSTCTNGTQTRTRTVITPASNGGTACPVLSETQSCTVVSDRVAMNFYDDPCGTTIGLWYSTSEELYYTSEFGSTKYTGLAYTPLTFNQSDWEWEYYDINEGSALGPFTTFSGCAPS